MLCEYHSTYCEGLHHNLRDKLSTHHRSSETFLKHGEVTQTLNAGVVKLYMLPSYRRTFVIKQDLLSVNGHRYATLHVVHTFLLTYLEMSEVISMVLAIFPALVCKYLVLAEESIVNVISNLVHF